MADLDQLRHPDNLHRAWRWIRSNPDAAYKSYFRLLYQHFAVAEVALLEDLADRLKRDIYEPEPSCKIFQPKPSGILRPISLLTVEDQIVYQAAVNLIAEKLYPRVVRRYSKQVFGHLYAGKTSIWFYRKWSDGYKAFNEAARQAFADGFNYTASFDLTACYDSLDHRVLRHFLEKTGLDREFSYKFTEWLEKWTATECGIFHNHGIPQGPLSSGLVSEVILNQFDNLNLKGADFRYFRYVDDIRLFAKNEHILRRLLVALDLLSKDIGLFPQSGKISIHFVHNIEDEIKTVSNPVESSITRPFVDQDKLLKRIEELTPRYKIINPTRFKYLLAHANPSAKLTARLWRILENHPEIYRSVCNYLRRYVKLPRVPAKKLIEEVKTNYLYQAVRAEFIAAADGRLPADQDLVLAKLLKRSWNPCVMPPDLQVAIGRFLLRTGNLSAAQISYACKAAPSWWSRAMLIGAADLDTVGVSTLKLIIGNGVKDGGKSPALGAAWQSFEIAYLPPGSRRNWNKAAELFMREIGLIRRSTVCHCGITHVFFKLDKHMPSLNWKSLFGFRHAQAERQAIEIVAASGVNITGFVNLLDVFNDLLLNAVFLSDGTIGTYHLGKIGSVLHSTTSAFATKYPKTFALAKEVHSSRYESMYSHPLINKTGKPTKKVSYRFLAKAKKLIRESAKEIVTAGLA
ncbi:MAG: RNA-directed DNA polymerase [Proteobacteria bacterium]|nr:RNA-directed DNA polymerase [Pseudomonadota bacterium]